MSLFAVRRLHPAVDLTTSDRANGSSKIGSEL